MGGQSASFPSDLREAGSMPSRSKMPRFGEIVGHAGIGASLGVFLLLILIISDTGNVFKAITTSSNPKIMFVTFVGIFSSLFAVGATLTGLIFSAIEDR
jgi:hypothetical protein